VTGVIYLPATTHAHSLTVNAQANRATLRRQADCRYHHWSLSHLAVFKNGGRRCGSRKRNLVQWSLSTLRALPLALADAISSFSSVILWSARSPPFKMHDVPTTYGLKVFIQLA
jgi:hypothetical protein